MSGYLEDREEIVEILSYRINVVMVFCLEKGKEFMWIGFWVNVWGRIFFK